MTTTTDEGAALLRAILERPECDVVRGAYADWLDEHDRPDHAEFIRVQCRIWEAAQHHCHETCRPPFAGCPNKALRERELELWHRLPTCQVFAPWAGGVSPDHTLPQFHIGGDQSGPFCIISRGFVSEVRLPLAAFVGTGTVEGVARRLFASQPVTTVTIVDKEPAAWDWREVAESDSRVEWYWDRDVRTTAGLPWELFDRLPGPAPALIADWELKFYPTREAALTALSDAACRYGRELAGLTNGGGR